MHKSRFNFKVKIQSRISGVTMFEINENAGYLPPESSRLHVQKKQ